MNAQLTSETRVRRNLIPGVALVIIGLVTLAAQLIKSEWIGFAFLPALGLIFLAWGLISRKSGLIIPGGILSGIGAGAILIEGPFKSVQDPARGAIFLLAFAAGWALISLLASLMERRFYAWPLIPGGILAMIGAALLSGTTGLKALALFGQGWPVILVAAGLYLILMRKDLSE